MVKSQFHLNSLAGILSSVKWTDDSIKLEMTQEKINPEYLNSLAKQYLIAFGDSLRMYEEQSKD
jgi:hypothetical protein